MEKNAISYVHLWNFFQMMESKCSSQKNALEDAEDVVWHLYYKTKLQSAGTFHWRNYHYILKNWRFCFHIFFWILFNFPSEKYRSLTCGWNKVLIYPWKNRTCSLCFSPFFLQAWVALWHVSPELCLLIVSGYTCKSAWKVGVLWCSNCFIHIEVTFLEKMCFFSKILKPRRNFLLSWN